MKTRNPYKVKDVTIRGFKGVVLPDQGPGIGNKFVGHCSNIYSRRMGEARTRDGNKRDSLAPGAGTVFGVEHDAGGRMIAIGTDLYADPVESTMKLTLEILP